MEIAMKISDDCCAMPRRQIVELCLKANHTTPRDLFAPSSRSISQDVLKEYPRSGVAALKSPTDRPRAAR